MIRCIAIDDEPLALDVIGIHASKIPDIEWCGSFTDPFSGLEFLKENPVDLVFLDINMPGLSGMELISRLKCPPGIVFTTAYSQYALDSYDYEAVDYLLKPIEFDRFNRAIQRYRKRNGDSPGNQSAHRPQHVFLKDGTRQVRIAVQDIRYIHSDRNYLEVYTSASRTITRMTINQLLSILNHDDFLRIQNSWVVNLSRIDRIENNHVHIGEMSIPIGEKYREGLLRRTSAEMG